MRFLKPVGAGFAHPYHLGEGKHYWVFYEPTESTIILEDETVTFVFDLEFMLIYLLRNGGCAMKAFVSVTQTETYHAVMLHEDLINGPFVYRSVTKDQLRRLVKITKPHHKTCVQAKLLLSLA